MTLDEAVLAGATRLASEAAWPDLCDQVLEFEVAMPATTVDSEATTRLVEIMITSNVLIPIKFLGE